MTDGEALLVAEHAPRRRRPTRRKVVEAGTRTGDVRRRLVGAAARDDGRQPDRPLRQPEHRAHRRPGAKPKAQLLGFRGAPGNTINHTTSYWIPNHSPKVFVEQVDVVSGVGYDRAAELGPAERASTRSAGSSPTSACSTSRRPDHTHAAALGAPRRHRRRGRRGDRLRARRSRTTCPRPRLPTDEELPAHPRGDRPERPARARKSRTRDAPRRCDTAACDAVRRRVPDRADRDGLGGRRPADVGDERGGRARHPRQRRR